MSDNLLPWPNSWLGQAQLLARALPRGPIFFNYQELNNKSSGTLLNKLEQLEYKGKIGVMPITGNPLWNGSKLQRAIFWCHLISIGLLLVVVSSDQTLTLILKISVECKDEEAAMHNLIFLIQLGSKRRESKSR